MAYYASGVNHNPILFVRSSHTDVDVLYSDCSAESDAQYMYLTNGEYDYAGSAVGRLSQSFFFWHRDRGLSFMPAYFRWHSTRPANVW